MEEEVNSEVKDAEEEINTAEEKIEELEKEADVSDPNIIKRIERLEQIIQENTNKIAELTNKEVITGTETVEEVPEEIAHVPVVEEVKEAPKPQSRSRRGMKREKRRMAK